MMWEAVGIPAAEGATLEACYAAFLPARDENDATEADVLEAVCSAVERFALGIDQTALVAHYATVSTGTTTESDALRAICAAVEQYLLSTEPQPVPEPEPEPEPEPTPKELRAMKLGRLVQIALQRALMTKAELDLLVRREVAPQAVLVALLSPPGQVVTSAGTLVMGEMVMVTRNDMELEAEAVDMIFGRSGLLVKFTFCKSGLWEAWDETWSVMRIAPPELRLLGRRPKPDQDKKYMERVIEKARAKHETKGKVIDLVTSALRELFLAQGVDLGQAFRYFDTDGSGEISAAELRAGLVKLKIEIPEERLEQLELAIDNDNNGRCARVGVWGLPAARAHSVGQLRGRTAG